MTFTTLISTSDLAASLTNPAFVIVDCRAALDDGGWGAREYAASHIPGAVRADLERDLSGPKTGRNGRHPLPDPTALAATFGRLGITGGVQVVAYDQDSGMYASRLWWLLRWMGHDDAAVLDGGFARWMAEGRPTSSGDETRAPRRFTGAPIAGMLVAADEVERLRGDSAWQLVDARAPDRFAGRSETIDRVAGHIPGARNHFFKSSLDTSGAFLPASELRATLDASIGGTLPDHVICYCGSGVSACHNILALEHAGLHGAKLYPGSWSEWCSDPDRPVATD